MNWFEVIIVNRQMKFKAITIVCLMCSAMCFSSNTSKVSAHNSPEWLTLSKEVQKKIVNDYADALSGFAQVMPKFGLDTKAQWAADTVHAMATDLKNNHYPFEKCYAIISKMQSYTGYGMAYLNATIGLNKEPPFAEYTLNIINESDSAYNMLQEKQFKDVWALSHKRIISITDMQMFNSLMRINNGKPLDYEIKSTLFWLGKLVERMILDDYTEKEIFKISSVLEFFFYFEMVCPLLNRFSGSQEKYDSIIDDIKEAAKHNDSKSIPIFNSIDDEKKIKAMSDSEFETWMITTSQHKVKLMKLLTKLVKEWNLFE